MGSMLGRAVDMVARLGIHGADQARERLRLAARVGPASESCSSPSIRNFPRSEFGPSRHVAA